MRLHLPKGLLAAVLLAVGQVCAEVTFTESGCTYTAGTSSTALDSNAEIKATPSSGGESVSLKSVTATYTNESGETLRNCIYINATQGYLNSENGSETISSDLLIKNLILTNGWGGVTHTFEGTIQGGADAVIRVNSRASGNASGGIMTQTFKFTGDISNYFGIIGQGASASDTSYTGLTLHFAGSETSNTVAAIIQNSSGTGKISSNTEFTGSSIDFGTLTIDANKSMTVGATTTLTVSSVLNSNGTLVNNGALVLNGNYSGKTIVNNGTISGTMNITSITGFDTVTNTSRMDVAGTVTTSGNGFNQKTATIFSGTGSLADSAVVQYNGTDITSSLQNGSTYSYWDKSTYYITGTDNTLNIQDLLNVDGVTSSVAIRNGATDENTTFVSSGDATIGTINSEKCLTFNVSGGTLTVGGHSNNGILITKNGSGTLKYTTASAIPSGSAILEIRGGNVELSTGGDTARIKGAIKVFGGASLTLSASDALGYGGGGAATKSITLTGTSESSVATMDIGNNHQTLSTSISMNGYAQIIGTNALKAYTSDTNATSYITISAANTGNVIKCDLQTRRGLELSVGNGGELKVEGTITHETYGASDAGLKKSGAGLLTVSGNTTLTEQLLVQGGTMKMQGATNTLNGAVKVSEGATLTLAGTTTLSDTLSFESSTTASDSVVKPLVEVTGGTTTVSNTVSGSGVMKVSGGKLILNGNNTYTNETRLSGGTIQAGNANAFGTSKLIVDGTGSISGNSTIADFIGVESGAKLTIKENSAITLSNTENNKGIWVKSGASVVLESGASVEGYNVKVSYLNENSKLAAEGETQGQFGTLGRSYEEGLTIKEAAISLTNGACLRNKLSGGTVSSAGSTVIGEIDNNTTYGGGSISSLEVTSGTLSVVSGLKVTTGTSVEANAKVDVSNADTSLGAVSGEGTVSSSVNQSVTLAHAAEGTGSSFRGTLEATGNQMTVTCEGSEYLFLAGIKANGGSINVMTTSGDAISGFGVSVSELVIGGGSTVGVYKGSTDTEDEEGQVNVYGSTDKKGSLTISGTEARLNADLVISSTALTLDGVLTMGSTLTLYSGNTLSGSLLTDWTDRTQALTLFEGVDGLYFNNATEGAQVGVEYDASTVFDGMTGYSLLMTGGTGGKDYTVQLVQNAPTPEPTTATLSLLALMGLAARRRRRKA